MSTAAPWLRVALAIAVYVVTPVGASVLAKPAGFGIVGRYAFWSIRPAQSGEVQE